MDYKEYFSKHCVVEDMGHLTSQDADILEPKIPFSRLSYAQKKEYAQRVLEALVDEYRDDLKLQKFVAESKRYFLGSIPEKIIAVLSSEKLTRVFLAFFVVFCLSKTPLLITPLEIRKTFFDQRKKEIAED